MSTQNISHEKEIAEIWKLFRETDRKMKEMSQETDRKMQKMSQETDRKMQETAQQMKETERVIKEISQEADRRIKEMSQETDRRMQENDRIVEENKHRIKYLDNLFTGQWGKLMESLVRGDLVELLKNKGITVNQILHDEEIHGTYEGQQWEFDIAAVNGDEVVVVEVKTTLNVKDVNHFVKKVEKFTELRPRFKGNKIYGAVAYLKANQSSNQYAERKGLFVIRATGSSASITNKEDFKPKVFS